MREFDTDRRRMLKATGATVAASFLAGCGGGGNGGDGGDGGDGSNGGGDRTPTQVATDWVTAEVGNHPGTTNFSSEGDIQETSTITNGDQPSGNYVFAPAVARVSPGTTVTWQWSSGPHTVTKLDGNGATLTDWSDTGETTYNQGHEHTATFDSAGVALYYCTPHLSSDGQVGAIIVE
jgi:serine/threonine-protein kinase